MSMRDDAWIEYLQSHNIEYPGSASYNAKNNNNNNPYIVDISKYNKLDIYRILSLYNVTDPCLQHSIKKLLCAGKRGVKNQIQDINEAILSLKRFVEMQGEDNGN